MDLQGLARRLTEVALAAVDPERLAREELARRGERFTAVVSLGKAAAALARGAREALEPGAKRLLIRPHTAPALLDPDWEQWSGGHPLPDRESVAAGERLERWLAEIPSGPLLALISGGTSACVESPAPGITLDDLIATHRRLLASGLPIYEVNAVRRQLSRLKGGGALRATGGRLPRILVLLLSDVPGDDPAVIASGPFEAAERVENVLLGSARTAASAVVAQARRQGFQAVDDKLEGEAAQAARELIERGRALEDSQVALVLAGETTVTLRGEAGHGGRNQELALAAARELAGGTGELVFTLATDGEDGPTRHAGAMVDGATWEILRRAGVGPEMALARHDSGTALAAVPGALLQTGPTGTNVGDLAVYLRVAPPAVVGSPHSRQGELHG